MRHFGFLPLLLVTIPVACAPVQDPITITSGPITGTVSDGVHVYKGIPYARPPVGSLRWHEPLPPEPWSQARVMTAYGPSCPQPDSPLDRDPETLNQSEDCLYLNVWSGAQDTNQRLPVMVWIHGGGLVNGSGSKPFYTGESLARRGAVVVTINYRLGPFGFFTHPDLAKQSPTGLCGNWGLLDQIAALRWVRDNIARLGGDPENVTVFGESAGALSVHALMTSPLARGLFHRAIAESGAASAHVRTLAKSQDYWRGKVKALGITDWERALPELRRKTTQDILKMSEAVGGLPGKTGAAMMCLDGQVLIEAPADAFVAGRQATVPFIVGSNADEGTLFAKVAPKTVMGYEFIVRRMFKDQAQEVLRLYPARINADVKDAFAAIIGDLSFTANARRSARWHAAAGHPTWRYFFSFLPKAAELSGLRVTHGLEIPFVFGTLPAALTSPAARTLSDQMGAYWLAFARTGRPEPPGLPAWPPYDPGRDNVLVFDRQITTQDHLRAEKCDLWDEVAEHLGERFEDR